ncbi:hypothetical protein [Runella sp. SP2]|uniref:hypothetical protein n=1 Tax=Runella sp. SP2 TaxID=2268026 RepID=UPI000F08BD07|nr:hypothetical protein [Runella sp. SP2]AYQ31650.1 hypothetical protein DTQ70_05415 [Runella sp. SP2]
MVRTTLVESDIERSKRIIKRLDNSGLKFPIVFWMYDDDADNWKLVLSRDDINKLGKRHYYKQLIDIISNSHLDDGLTITLMDSNESLIKSLKTVVTMPNSWFVGNTINGKVFPDSYLHRVNL